MNLAKPGLVSTELKKDVLVIEINNKAIFESAYGVTTNTTTLKVPMPK
jgi:hypothetical protein